MPAVSKKQQQFFSIVKQYKDGKLKDSEVSDNVRQVAKSMSDKDISDFVNTDTKKLPDKITQKEYIMDTLLRKMIREELDGFLHENTLSLESQLEFIDNSSDIVKETSYPFSSPTAKEYAENAIRDMGSVLTKTAHVIINRMNKDIKSGKYDAIDLHRVITQGDVRAVPVYEREFINNIWLRIRDGFRKFTKNRRLRK